MAPVWQSSEESHVEFQKVDNWITIRGGLDLPRKSLEIYLNMFQRRLNFNAILYHARCGLQVDSGK